MRSTVQWAASLHCSNCAVNVQTLRQGPDRGLPSHLRRSSFCCCFRSYSLRLAASMLRLASSAVAIRCSARARASAFAASSAAAASALACAPHPVDKHVCDICDAAPLPCYWNSHPILLLCCTNVLAVSSLVAGRTMCAPFPSLPRASASPPSWRPLRPASPGGCAPSPVGRALFS